MAERQFWDKYQSAYEDMIRNTATKENPWYIVPADTKWFSRLVVAAAVIDTMAGLHLSYPLVDEQKLAEIATVKKALMRTK